MLVGNFYLINKITVNQLAIWNYCCLAFPAKALLVTNKRKGGKKTHARCSGELPSSQQNLARAPEFHISLAAVWAVGHSLLYRSGTELKRG